MSWTSTHNRQIINTDQSLPEVELANNRMCFQTILQTISGTHPSALLIFEFLKITDLPGMLSKQSLIRLLVHHPSRFVTLGLVENNAAVSQIVKALTAENLDETMSTYSTDESDCDEEAEQDQSDRVMFGRTKDPQSPPKKEDILNLFKCSMSPSVTSELKLDRKEGLKVVLEHWDHFKPQHFRAIIEHYLDP